MVKNIDQIIEKLDKNKGKGYNLDQKFIDLSFVYVNNDITLYNYKMKIVDNYRKKKSQGNYKRSLAIKGVADNLMPYVIRYYKRYHGNQLISMENRVAAAIEIVDEIEMEYLR